MAQKKKPEATEREEPAMTEMLLTPYERVTIADRVLDFTGGSLAERMRATYVRRALDFSEAEKEAMGYKKTGSGHYWNAEHAVFEVSIRLEEDDVDLIRECIKLMVAREALVTDQRFDALLFKLFTEAELVEISDEHERRKKKSEKKEPV